MPKTGFRPLYQQVYDILLARIAKGVWPPGSKLPSEFSLADDLQVSQGTVRKALNALADRNIVVRQQGRGTFVPEQTASLTLSRFSRLRNPDGTPAISSMERQSLSRQTANRAQLAAFGQADMEDLWTAERVLRVGSDIPMLEIISIRPDLIPGLDKAQPLPENLFKYYQKSHGITISRIKDRLSAVAARRFHVRRIGVEAGTPLLVSQRVAYDLRGRAIELRATYFPTDKLNYTTSLI